MVPFLSHFEQQKPVSFRLCVLGEAKAFGSVLPIHRRELHRLLFPVPRQRNNCNAVGRFKFPTNATAHTWGTVGSIQRFLNISFRLRWRIILWIALKYSGGTLTIVKDFHRECRNTKKHCKKWQTYGLHVRKEANNDGPRESHHRKRPRRLSETSVGVFFFERVVPISRPIVSPLSIERRRAPLS